MKYLKNYIKVKLSEGILTGLALPVVFDIARTQAVTSGTTIVKKIQSIYNQNKYSKKDCSGIMSPEERLKCEIYTKIKISNIRLKYLYQIKKNAVSNADLETIDRYIQKEQNLILNHKNELLSI